MNQSLQTIRTGQYHCTLQQSVLSHVMLPSIGKGHSSIEEEYSIVVLAVWLAI